MKPPLSCGVLGFLGRRNTGTAAYFPSVAVALVVVTMTSPAGAQCGDVNMPSKAKGMRTSMVRAYSQCPGPHFPGPNDSTGGGTPTCSDPVPAELSEFRAATLFAQWPVPPAGGATEYKFAGAKSSCQLSIGSSKVENPCSNGSAGPCTNARVKLKCNGIVDGSGAPVSGGSWSLAIVLRSTLHQLGGDMTVGDSPIGLYAAVKDGSVSLDLRLADIADVPTIGYLGSEQLRHLIAGCVTNEIVEAVLLDPMQRPFAVPGIASTGTQCQAVNVAAKSKGMRLSMVRAYTHCPGAVFAAPTSLTDEGAAACGPTVPAEMSESWPADTIYRVDALSDGTCTPFGPCPSPPGPSHYKFAGKGSGCSLTVGAKVENPCAFNPQIDPNNGTPGPCTNFKMKLRCKGIVDSLGNPVDGPSSAGFSVALRTRATTVDDGGLRPTMTVIDFPTQIPASLPKSGSFKAEADSSHILDGLGLPSLRECISQDIPEVVVLDPDGRVLATLGLSSPS